MTTKEVADGLVALCKEGKFNAAIEAYYGEGIVSLESAMPEGMDPKSVGLEAVLGKAAWWEQSMEVKSGEVVGPFVNGDQFTVFFRLEVVQKEDGKELSMEEIALYTVEAGKIVCEVFFN